jgi:diguanylate cyclase (GGDEF)-like protein/PAS domain S-box-containing protein
VTSNLRRGVAICAAVVFCLLAGGTTIIVETARRQAMRAAERQLEHAARVAENAVSARFLEVDSMLASLPALLAILHAPDGNIRREAASRALRGLYFGGGGVQDLLLLGEDRAVWAAGRPRTRTGLDLASLGPSPPGGLGVFGPMRNATTGEWQLVLVRPLVIPGAGRVDAVALVPISMLTARIAAAVDLPELRVLVTWDDGRLIGGIPHAELRMGHTVEDRALGQARDGAARLVGDDLAANRSSFHNGISVGLRWPVARALADWRRDRDRLILIATVLGGVVLLFSAALSLALKKQERLDAARQRSQQMLEDAIEGMSDGFVMWDADDRLAASNARYRELYAKSAAAMTPGTKFESIIRYGVANGQYPQAADPDRFVAETVAWHRAGAGALERLLPDGRWLLVTERRTANGGTVGIRTDITLLKQTMAQLADANERVQEALSELEQRNAALTERDRELKVQNARFDAALNNMAHGLLMVDRDGQVIVFNERFRDLFGLESADMGTLDDVFSRDGVGPFEARELRARLLSQQQALAAERASGALVVSTEDGAALSVIQRPMKEGGFVAIYEDVTEKHLSERRISYLAHHDTLTGLPNRTQFHTALEALTREPQGTGVRLAVMCLDLDKFKDVNDTRGHPVGDDLLRAVAERIRQCVAGPELVARLGGDEFAVAIRSDDAWGRAERLATELIRSIGEPYSIAGATISVAASVGAVVTVAGADDVDTLMKRADMALYAAKSRGGGAFALFEPDMERELVARTEIEADLRGALADGQFELAYQPQYALETGALTGFEALLRWNHPLRGRVAPGEFIAIAETSGLIDEIGRWCLERACADMHLFPDHIVIAVNLSPVQLRSPEMANIVTQALARSGLAPRRLQLEITESALLGENEQIVSTLHRIREMGICVVLDDFGTGYSSLSHLRFFPFGKIKIDRSFVEEITTRHDCAVIVAAVVGLARELGIATTAEGVETPEQLQRVREIGCTEAQGFLLGKPQPVLSAYRAPSSLDMTGEPTHRTRGRGSDAA